MRISKNHRVASLGLSAMVAGSPAFAMLEEVIVTVNKREESLMDVAGSVQILDVDTIDDFRLNNLDVVVDLVPNATFTAAPSGTPILAIRGVGTRAGGAMLEQDVGLFVDGVWLGRNNQMQAALMDMRAIEVLKGTQATLYGRNTLVGAVSISTQKPGDELEGFIKTGYEFEYDSTSVEAAVSIPISDKFAVRLAAMYEDQGGWIDNKAVNRDEPQQENSALRLTGVYLTDNEWEITGKVQTASRELTGNSFVRLLEGTFTGYDGTDEFTPAPPPSAALLGYDVTVFGTRITAPVLTNADIGAERDFTDFSLQFDIPVGDNTVTAISGYNEMEYQSAFDPSILAGPRVVSWYDEDYDQFTQEIRLTSPAGEAFDYIAGMYYVEQSVDRLTFQYLNDDKRFWYGKQDMDAWSIFATGTWALSDTVRLTGGARYTDENKDADIIVLGSNEDPDVFAAASEDISEDTLDGSITVEWDLKDNLLLFGGVATGSKRPGLASGNPVNNADFVGADSLFIPTEEIVTLEAGFKYGLENGYVNVTVFDMDISDFQNASFTNGNIAITSFDIDSRGVEIDSLLWLADSISLHSGLGFMDVEDVTNNADVSGAPDFSASVTLSYESTAWIDGLDSRFSLNVNHKSSHFLNATTGVNNRFNEIDAVTLLNATLSMTHINSGIELSVFGKNLSDEEYADFSFNAPGGNNDYMFSVAQGITLGVEASYNF